MRITVIMEITVIKKECMFPLVRGYHIYVELTDHFERKNAELSEKPREMSSL
jgi:hypothetical protein